MNDRRALGYELDDIQQQMKELEIRYEQYFAGVEKREPQRERVELAKRLRQYTSRRIIQTDLKFRCHGLTSRFMSYSQYWDRILRLIDEGKYHRHTTRLNSPTVATSERPEPGSNRSEVERLQRELSEARRAAGIAGEAPSISKIAAFLDAQRETISSRYGDRPVQFSIDTSDGKPRIKVSLKK
ncbi:MAG TPA: MXAN_5187 C-terminal domain-containing protein [Malonomonas sp.]